MRTRLPGHHRAHPELRRSLPAALHSSSENTNFVSFASASSSAASALAAAPSVAIRFHQLADLRRLGLPLRVFFCACDRRFRA